MTCYILTEADSNIFFVERHPVEIFLDKNMAKKVLKEQLKEPSTMSQTQRNKILYLAKKELDVDTTEYSDIEYVDSDAESTIIPEYEYLQEHSNMVFARHRKRNNFNYNVDKQTIPRNIPLNTFKIYE